MKKLLIPPTKQPTPEKNKPKGRKKMIVFPQA